MISILFVIAYLWGACLVGSVLGWKVAVGLAIMLIIQRIEIEIF